MRRVVITGLGAITPLGNNVPELWAGLIAGKSGAAEITRFDHSAFKTHFACEVKAFDPLTCLDRKEARKFDRFAQYAIAAAAQAMQDASFDLEAEDTTRMGVIWSSGVGGIETFEKEITDFATGDGTPRFNPFFITKFIPDIAAGEISIRYGLKGPNYSISSACASSAHAIGEAFYQIRSGRADVIVTGGSEAPITRGGIGGFNAIRALSTRNDSPQTACRPFSASRDGFVLGEGAGCLILEEYEHATRRGATIYAEIAGAGMTADAYHITAPEPEGQGASLVMLNALKEAGLSICDVDYINTHGTSTPRGDIAEHNAIKNTFGKHAYNLNLSSTKSMTGHLLGATGAVEAIASILAIKTGIIPPTINHNDDDIDPEIDYNLNFTFNKAQQREINVALSNTFGFGGHNACLTFKKI